MAAQLEINFKGGQKINLNTKKDVTIFFYGGRQPAMSEAAFRILRNAIKQFKHKILSVLIEQGSFGSEVSSEQPKDPMIFCLVFY